MVLKRAKGILPLSLFKQIQIHIYRNKTEQALYFCENECLLGYYKMLEQIKNRTGGLLMAIYSDRSQIFFTTRGATFDSSL